MESYGRFTPPKSNSRTYRIDYRGIESLTVPGLDLRGRFLVDASTERAKSWQNAVLSALGRYGMSEECKTAVLSGIEKAGVENFVRDLGPSPPQVKKMIRSISLFNSEDAAEVRKRYAYDYEGLVRDYRVVEAAMKESGAAPDSDPA